MIGFCKQKLQKGLPEFEHIADYGYDSHQFFAERELELLLIGYTSRPNVNWNEYLIREGYRILKRLKHCPRRPSIELRRAAIRR